MKRTLLTVSILLVAAACAEEQSPIDRTVVTTSQSGAITYTTTLLSDGKSFSTVGVEAGRVVLNVRWMHREDSVFDVTAERPDAPDATMHFEHDFGAVHAQAEGITAASALLGRQIEKMVNEKAGIKAYDSQGCDSIAGALTCSIGGGCCDDHDACYAKAKKYYNQTCDGTWGWLTDIGTPCGECNSTAISCVALS